MYQRMENEPTNLWNDFLKRLKFLTEHIRKLYKDLHVHPYKVQSHQTILPVDYFRCLAYCQWLAYNLSGFHINKCNKFDIFL